jgi:uncharacterized protein (TIGR01244 family)
VGKPVVNKHAVPDKTLNHIFAQGLIEQNLGTIMSLHFTKHTDEFSTAAQVMLEQIKEVAAAGFKTLINNRPDGEAADQPTHEQVKEAAAASGLHYIFLPVVSSQVSSAAAEFGQLLDAAPKPALAFCRSGTRSTMLYQTAMALKPAK